MLLVEKTVISLLIETSANQDTKYNDNHRILEAFFDIWLVVSCKWIGQEKSLTLALFVSWSPASATRVSDQRLRHDVADSCSFEGRAIDRSGCRYAVRFYVARLIAAIVAMLFVSVSLQHHTILCHYLYHLFCYLIFLSQNCIP
ncbi:unnamed protein product [Brassica rapa subsp. trilocularis]